MVYEEEVARIVALRPWASSCSMRAKASTMGAAARAPHEIGHAQAAEKSSRASGGQHVTRTRGKIPHGRRRVVADHDGAGRRDRFHERLRRARRDEQFEMLGRDVVGHGGGLRGVVHDDGQKPLGQHARRLLGATDRGQLSLHFGVDRVDNRT
jgi:hypothetical protein